jgi:hypothetical protein
LWRVGILEPERMSMAFGDPNRPCAGAGLVPSFWRRSQRERAPPHDRSLANLLASLFSYTWRVVGFALLIPARVEVSPLVLAPAEEAQVVDTPVAAGQQQPFCYILQGIAALPRQGAMRGV